MMLEGNNASVAIRWVRQDLDDALEVIRDNLEYYAEDTSQRDSLKLVQDKLEQLNLTFLTMEQRGASLLTDEMIAVGGHMLHDRDANVGESLAALTDAVVVLPAYLDRLQAGHEDLPILLLPTLNELRATYDEKLLSEGTLFAPQLDVMIPELGGSEADAVAENEFGSFARRIRGQYQMALLGWLKEQSKHELLEPLIAVCRTLHQRLGRHDLRRLWWIADRAISGFRDGAIDNDLPLRRLFARLDLNLKAMAEQGLEGPSEDAVTALSRALLFHAAQAKPGSEPMELLRRRFKLEELIPDREALLRAKGAVTGRDAELFASIGVAVREEMAQVKDALDMELRTGRVEAEQREVSLNSLRQLADTLYMLNLPVPARAVEDLLPQLEATAEAEMDSLDSPLLTLARKLIEVEAILETHIRLLGEPVDDQPSPGYIDLPAHEQRQIISTLLGECVVSLHAAQEIVRKRLAGESKDEFHAELEQISGALKLAGQPEISGLVEKLARCLNAGLHASANGAKAEAIQLDSLTDAVAALELYLAGCRDEQANSMRYIEIMHHRLDGLPEASSAGESLATTDIQLPSRPQPEATEPARIASEAATPQQIATDAGAEQAGADQVAIDPAMQEVFLEEFDAVRRQLEDVYPSWAEQPANEKTMAEIRRGFHTLKGSGRMVGATEIGDFAWRVEELLNRIVEKKLEPGEAVVETVRLSVAALGDLRARLLQQSAVLDAAAVAGLGDFARQLARRGEGTIEQLHALLPETFLQPQGAAEQAEEQAVSLEREPQDTELAQAMMAEIREHAATLEQFTQRLQQGKLAQVAPEVVRAAHTLGSTFALSPLGQESEVARALESWLEALQKHGQVPDRTALPVLQLALHRFHQRLFILEDGQATSYPLDDIQLLEQISGIAATAAQQARASDSAADTKKPATASQDSTQPAVPGGTQPQPSAELDPELAALDGDILAIFLEEAGDVLERCDTLLNTWRDRLADLKLVQNLQREIHTFKGGARMAGLEGLGSLSHAMETLLENIAAQRLQATIAAVQALEEGCDALTVFVEQIESGRMPQVEEAIVRFDKRLSALSGSIGGKQDKPAAAKTSARSKAPAAKDAPVDSGQAKPARVEAPTKVQAKAQPEAQPEAQPKAQPEAPAATSQPTTTQSGQQPAAEASHGRSGKDEKPTADKPAVEQEARQDVKPKVEHAQTIVDAAPGKEQDAAPGKAPESTSRPAVASPTPATRARPRVFHDVPDQPMVENGDESGGPQHIRVAAELMDTLVNHAGEISICRARLEQQLGTVRFNLKETEQTIDRLKEQLRKLDMESEAQMMSRYQHASTKSATEFDPLELDRFSNMQQLSRAINESINDLLNLQEMLGDSVRQAEALLVQQSRVSVDLQEGLMQTRMTPFGSAAPRLRRVVRAAAAETGKRARLQLRMAGSNDQLDRNVLERITAPLEHMLRNAVVHGIESPAERARLNKPEEGEIIVTVEAEATEFVLRVEDDGGGINLPAVRKRAIERGLIKADEDVTDRRLSEFIMESGFSTATTVTGLAGRGVGMDVVNAEIKQIGGSMDIDSEAGKGTSFTIRIPFSLAVLQAIGVVAGSRQYLVPLTSVAGVSRISPSEYQKLRDQGSPHYEFAGESFPLMDLEPLLGEETASGPAGNISLLMIRSGDHKAAFRVSELQGHQEVVMKPVGPQISSIPGILGATISGDGQVVLILDMGPVIRRGLALAAAPAVELVPKPKDKLRQPLVMVVDDSITMRKVTSRVLENHALEVITAQDGVDAIENLHERIPDLMLLDIEMPRMDGYELAEHVRADPRLRHVPIVMITSRAGQKHRKRARDAGANDYMTKPYQEADLVAKVSEMLKLELQQRRPD